MLARFDRALLGWNRVLLMGLLALMSVLVFANVLLRYTVGDSIVWAEELSRYLMIWLTCLGAGLVLRVGGHLAVETLQDAVPTGAARVLRLACVLFTAAFAGAMAWLGVLYVLRAWAQTTPVLELPFGLVYAALPAGFVLLLLHLAMFARGYVLRRAYDRDDEFDSGMSASL